MAKPENWDSMTEKERTAVATRLLTSMRGGYILSQALYIASEELKKVEPPVMREQSNIEDMEILMETFFNIYSRVEATKKVQ